MQTTDPWHSFWQNAARHGKTDSGVKDPALANAWQNFFQTEFSQRQVHPLSMLDMGCGDGAISQIAQAEAERIGLDLQITCLDSSAAALEQAQASLPNAQLVTASAADSGLDDKAFDLVVSQFGVEYAGQEGIAEAARLLAPSGQIALVIHQAGSAIDTESRATVAAISAVQDSGILAAICKLCDESMAIRRGEGSRVGFELADRALAPCVKAVEETLQEQGKSVASGLPFRIYSDVAQMYRSINNYDSEDIQHWADQAGVELEGYRQRMQSMLDAGLDTAGVEAAAQVLAAAGIEITQRDSLQLQDQRAAAWRVLGQRSS